MNGVKQARDRLGLPGGVTVRVKKETARVGAAAKKAAKKGR